MKSQQISLALFLMAEGGGFEPPIEKFPITDFESAAFDHSATLPKNDEIISDFYRKIKGIIPSNTPPIFLMHVHDEKFYF